MDGTHQLDEVNVDHLVESVKRVELFECLEDGPRNLRELDRHMGLSRSTIHRTTRSFIDQGLLNKCGEQFELSGLGELVADELCSFQNRMEALRRLEPFLNTVDPSSLDIPIEYFGDAVVSSPTAGQPHVGVRRIIEGIEASDSLRMFSSIISPIYVGAAKREMDAGTEITVIFDTEILDVVVSEYYADALEALDTGNFEVYVHDGVPFELFIFEDSMGMAAHDENGIPRAFVETDSPDAIEWAHSLYRTYEQNAEYVNDVID